MACSVAPASAHQMFHRVGGLGFARASKPCHRRSGAVVFVGTDDEVAEVLVRPAVVPEPETEETRLTGMDWIGDLGYVSKPRHRRTVVAFDGTDDEVAEVLRPYSDSFTIAEVPAEEETFIVAAPPPRFPTGVLGEPPQSLARSSGSDMTAAFLASVAAAGDAGSSDTKTDERDLLVARRTERKEACSRRSRYLRDYCPFQRGEEESEPKKKTTTLLAEPDHAEEVEAPSRVKTGLPFDSPESEAEFVKAIRSRYLVT